MFRKILITLVVLIVCAGGLVVAHPTVQAQNLTPEERVVLQQQYDELQKEIVAQQQIIKDTQAKKNTLQGDVTTLNAQIKAAQAKIDAKNIVIKQLASQIVQKNAVIVELSDRISRGKESLASILRQEAMIDNSSVMAIMLSNDDLSSFFADLDSFVLIKTGLKNLFIDIRDAKAQTETEKAALATKQNQTVDAKYEVVTQQKQIASDKTEKQQLLTITANQEVGYQKVLAERQAKAAAIRAALFPLRDAGAITFGDALAYAKAAQAKTGVRPAFILAVLTQESNLGKDVGKCYLSNNTTGAGVGKNTGTPFSLVMPGPLAYQNYLANNKSCIGPNAKSPCSSRDDVSIFLTLSQQLGFDPHHQVVSCPIASAGGWGGAMGPAQFIPSTWHIFESRISATTGHAVPNPWAADDAIAAMSLYFDDLGAGAGGYTAEYTAAAKYYAGGNWATAGRGYGASVMALAEGIQKDIDFLK